MDISKSTQKHPNRRKQGPRRLKRVEIDSVQRQLMVVLEREVQQLLDQSFLAKLSPPNAKDLANYLKLLKDLREAEEASLENLSDEDLQKLQKQKNKGLKDAWK